MKFIKLLVATILGAALLLSLSACARQPARSIIPGPPRSVTISIEPGFQTPPGVPFDPLDVFVSDLRRRLYDERGYREGPDVRLHISVEYLNPISAYVEYRIDVETNDQVKSLTAYYQAIATGDSWRVPDGAPYGTGSPYLYWDRGGLSEAALAVSLQLESLYLGRAPRPELDRNAVLARACRAQDTDTILPTRSYQASDVYVSGQRAPYEAPYLVAYGTVSSVQVVITALDVARGDLHLHPTDPVRMAMREHIVRPGPEQAYYLLQHPGTYELAAGRTGDPDCRPWQELVNAKGGTDTARLLGPGRCLKVRRVDAVTAPLEIRFDPTDSFGRAHYYGRLYVNQLELRDRTTQRVLSRRIQTIMRWADAANNPDGKACVPEGGTRSRELAALLGVQETASQGGR